MILLPSKIGILGKRLLESKVSRKSFHTLILFKVTRYTKRKKKCQHRSLDEPEAGITSWILLNKTHILNDL